MKASLIYQRIKTQLITSNNKIQIRVFLKSNVFKTMKIINLAKAQDICNKKTKN